MATYSRRGNDDAGEPSEAAGAPPDPRDDIDPLDFPEEEQVVYDLSAWPMDVHAEVVEALADAGLPHSWLGTDLVVHERHEDAADALLGEIERRHGLESEDDAPREPGSEVEYDLAEWNVEARALLTGRMIEADIPFRWEGALLVTSAEDEARADAVLDGVEQSLEADGLAAADDQGESPLAALFVAVDELCSRPNNRDAILRLSDLLDQAEGAPVPFGLNPASWERLLDQVSDLLDLSLESEEVDDVKAEAVELREALRPLV